MNFGRVFFVFFFFVAIVRFSRGSRSAKHRVTGHLKSL